MEESEETAINYETKENRNKKGKQQNLGLMELLLLTTGDIESNPGPRTSKRTTSILKRSVTRPRTRELLRELPKIR